MKVLLFLLILCVLPLVSGADTTNPRFFNFQSIMRGDNGELVTDPFIDLEFQITDDNNQVLYSEEQKNIQVIRGAVNVLVGEGTLPGTNQLTGGLPADIFDPRTGSKFLRFQVGANLMGDGIELVSMPYAYWSEQALKVVPNAIGSEEIKDGSIELKDLARSIQFSDVQGTVTEAQVPASLATDAELAAHATAKVAHKASQISVEGPYMAYPAKNVEEIIKALDEKVYLYKVNGKEDVAKATNGATGALGAHVSATLAHGSDGTVVGKNTLDASILGLQGQINAANTNVTTEFQAGDSLLQTNLANHAAQTQGVHGLTSVDPNNAIVGTTETQTLTNKTLENPILNGGSLIGDANTLIDLGASIGDGKGLKLPQGTANPPNSNNLVGLLFWDTDDGLLKVSTGTGWLTAGNPFGASVDSGEISDGTISDADISGSSNITQLGQTIESGEISDDTITNSDIAPAAGIADTKLATITTAGKVADSALSANVTKLGGSIESGEITDGTITNTDLNGSAGITDSKLATISTAGKVADSALSGNVTKLGGSIESGEITDGTISNSDISASAAIDWSKVNKTEAAPGDIGAAPASHAHTDADIPNTITVDFATTAGSATKATSLSANGTNCTSGQFAQGVDASGNAEGCAAVSVDTSGFVQKSGDTMTGELKVPDQTGIALNAGNFSVGKALRDHETRIAGLEGKDTISFSKVTGSIAESQVPQFMRPFAFGTVDFSNGVPNPGALNLTTSAAGVDIGLGDGCINIKFNTAPSSSNYTVSAISNMSSGHAYTYISGKSPTGFTVCYSGTTVPTSMDVLVFGNL